MTRPIEFLLVAALAITAGGGCNGAPSPNGQGPVDGPATQSQGPEKENNSMKYTCAEVVHVVLDSDSDPYQQGPDGRKYPNRLVVTRMDDQAEIRRLVSFFPGLDTGRTSTFSGPWMEAVLIRLTRADGTKLVLRCGCGFWYEVDEDGRNLNDGDLELSDEDEFWAYFRQLKAERTWKPFSEGASQSPESPAPDVQQ